MPEQLATPQGIELNDGQWAAVTQIVTSRDHVQGLQGGAGTGKTTVLSAIKAEAERAGYAVRGFAPTTRAAQFLAADGIESQTLQKFLRQRDGADTGKRLLILDKSSLASTRQLNAFLAKARPEDHVLLVGDMRQQEGVESSSPFAQLQKHGLRTAKLEKTYTDTAGKPSVARARQVNKATALDTAQQPSLRTLQKDNSTHEQAGRTQTQARADQAREGGAAGVVAGERHYSAFDRGRIRPSATRAALNARAGGGVDERDRGTAGGTEGATSRERTGQQPGGRVGAATDRDERADGRAASASGDESRRTACGHAREPASDRRAAGRAFDAAEQPRAAAGGNRDGAQRHAAPNAEGRDTAGADKAMVRTAAAPPAAAETHAHRTAHLSSSAAAEREPPIGGRAEQPGGVVRTTAYVAEGDLRGHSRPAAGGSDLPRRAGGVVDAGQPVDDRSDQRADNHCAALAGRELAHVADGDEGCLSHDHHDRIDAHAVRGDRVRDLQGVDSAVADRRGTTGSLTEPTQPRIADEVRAILDRPAQVERMALELVQFAIANRLAQGQPPIDEQVQEYMRARLMDLAEHPPAPTQAERDRQIAQALGHEEPRHENALQSALYAARHAPNRDELLERFTGQSEAALLEQQQPQARTPDHATELHSWQQSRDDFSISR